MKWISLKLSNVNEIYNEYDQVCFYYNQLRSNLKFAKTKKAESEFRTLKEDIKNRIKELNNFYNKHINDSRIGAFEIIQNKLEMLLANKDSSSIISSQSSSSLIKNSAPVESNIIKKELKEEATGSNRDISNCNIDNNNNDDENEIFTCCNTLLASYIKHNVDQWKEIFLKIKLTEAEYNILFKDANFDSH